MQLFDVMTYVTINKSYYLKMQSFELVSSLLVFTSIIVAVTSFLNVGRGNRGRSFEEKNPILSPANNTFAQIYYRTKRVDNLVDVGFYYEKCGVTKGCVPNNCLDSKDCEYLIAWTILPLSEYIDFQILAKKIKSKDGQTCSFPTPTPVDDDDDNSTDTRAYLSVAFNSEPSMEKAVILECSIVPGKNNSGGVIIGWHKEGRYRRFEHECTEGARTGKFMHCQVDIDAKNVMVCEFRLKRRIIVMQEIYHFAKTPHYIHVFSGCNVSLVHEDFKNAGDPFVTDDGVDLDDYDERRTYLETVKQ